MDGNKIAKIFLKQNLIILPALIGYSGISATMMALEEISYGLNIISEKKKTENLQLAITDLQRKIKGIAKEIYDNGETFREYIDKKILPFALQNAQKEQQKEKIEFMMNGVISIIKTKEEQSDDFVFLIYDVFNELRLIELKLLFDIGGCEQQNDKKESIRPLDEEDIPLNYMYRKLENLSLISIETAVADLVGGETKITKDRIKISKFGEKFIEFFSNRESLQYM